MNWSVFLPFEPQAKRAQTASKSAQGVWVVDPDKLLKNDIAESIFQISKLPGKPFEKALRAVFEFRFQLPASISKTEAKRRHREVWCPEIRKDLDNCVKLYQDALNVGALSGKILSNDHLICELVARKTWAELPGISIELSLLDSEFSNFF